MGKTVKSLVYRRLSITRLVCIALFFVQCTDKEHIIIDPNAYFCDAENLSDDGKRFVYNGHEFEGANGRTDEEAYEGEYSCVTNSENPYGFGITLKDLKPNESIEIQVYRKSINDLGGIAIHSLDGSLKLGQFTSLVEKDEEGWDYIRMVFKLPSNINSIGGGITVFMWHQFSDENVYFDNFQIKKIIDKEDDKFGKNEPISIQLSDIDYKKISEARDLALKNGIIGKALKKTYRGFLTYQQKTYSIDIRLKGDWTDHLIGNKWSYRIKIKNGETFMGLKTFSIQNPSTRGFLHEWVFHKLLEQEDVLTTRYDFFPVSINGSNFGLYALEEHFEKRLLEHRNRREGVIVKFDESGLWEARGSQDYMSSHAEEFVDEWSYEVAEIKPFSKKKVKKSAKLSNQFLIAQNHMHKYKEGVDNIEKYMDIEQLAKAYALMVVGNVSHSLIWHNQRFYFNPVTAKLEPILFDCYPDLREAKIKPIFIYGGAYTDTTFVANSKYNYYKTLANPELQQAYLAYLKEYSSTNFIDKYITTIASEIDSLSHLIAIDNLRFDYNKSFLSKNAKKVRKLLPDYKNKIRGARDYYGLKKTNFKTGCENHLHLKSIAINAHLQKKNNNGSVNLSLKNYHCHSLNVIGYSTKETADSLLFLPNPIVLKSRINDAKDYQLSLKATPKKIFFKVLGVEDDSIYSSTVIPWQRPESDTKLDNLMNSNLRSNSPVYSLTEKQVIFRKGKFVVKENIIIPKGLAVIFEPGVELVFNKNKFLMSYSAISMKGTEQEPIKIISTDGTGNGFTVLQAKNKSKLEYVIFDGLNTFNNYKWSITGAVTFYESDVALNNCTFTNAHSEDALNIIRSNFQMENCTISNAFSDGFDADFCEGSINNSSFIDIGNDCLDFSGSTIKITNCEINNVVDKGVSCGEKSYVIINNIKIKGANIGIASKDMSEVTAKEATLVNCQTGFTVFQKKSEYGPAIIHVEKCSMEQVLNPYMVEFGSDLYLDNKKVVGSSQVN